MIVNVSLTKDNIPSELAAAIFPIVYGIALCGNIPGSNL